MADFRGVHDGQCYFFTVVSYRRRPILCNPPVRRSLRQAVLDVRQDFDFNSTHGFCCPTICTRFGRFPKAIAITAGVGL